ncbi:hypothetical protein F4859DRAFT_85183 [Xylaria cf. heliscus]|nr:hypothetical protein F4859DRAFT_85183 [Xylaria cf. heliscus]
MSKRRISAYTYIIPTLVNKHLQAPCSRGPLHTSRPSKLCSVREVSKRAASSGRHVSWCFWSAPFFPGAGEFLEPVVSSETIPGRWIIKSGGGRAQPRDRMMLGRKEPPTPNATIRSPTRRIVGIGPHSLPSCRCYGCVLGSCQQKIQGYSSILDHHTPRHLSSRLGKSPANYSISHETTESGNQLAQKQYRKPRPPPSYSRIAGASGVSKHIEISRQNAMQIDVL